MQINYAFAVHNQDSTDARYLFSQTRTGGLAAPLAIGTFVGGQLRFSGFTNPRFDDGGDTTTLTLFVNKPPSNTQITATITGYDAALMSVNPESVVFGLDNWKNRMPVTLSVFKTVTDANKKMTLTIDMIGKAGDRRFRDSNPVKVPVDINISPLELSYTYTRATIQENFGKETTARNTRIRSDGFNASTPGDNAFVSYEYSIPDSSSIFAISQASSLDPWYIALKQDTNLNHERKDTYTIDLQIVRIFGSTLTLFTDVIVTISDIAEQPSTYTSHNLQTMAVEREQIVMTWNNNEYENEFDAADRGGLTLSYATGGGSAVNIALPADRLTATITGLSAGTPYTLSLGWKSAGDEISWSARRSATTPANKPPAFAAAAVSYDLDENVGRTNNTAVDTDIGAPVTATDPESDTPITYRLDPVSAEFKISNSGQIKVKTATHFNQEKTAVYTLTIKAADGYTPSAESAGKEVVINITDQQEKPNDYTAHSFSVDGSTATKITLSWNNLEYIAQFEDQDRYSLVISYGTGGSAATGSPITLASDATAATLTGLTADTSYDITLNWLSKDNLRSDTPATTTGRTAGGGVEIDQSGKSDLTADSKTTKVSLRLMVVPDSAAVTLTLTSGNDAHVEVEPDKMVFNTTTWNTWQELTLKLTDAGAAVLGKRNVAIAVAVHDQSNSDVLYRSLAAAQIAATVNIPTGADLYTSATCDTCHGANGQGVASFPPLSPLSSRIVNNQTRAISLVLYGGNGMSAFGNTLSDAEIALILTHVYTGLGSNRGSAITEAQVALMRTPPADTQVHVLARNESPGKTTTGNTAGTELLTLSATGGSSPQFSIVAGDSAIFGVHPANGTLSLKIDTNFNYEKKSSYTLTLRATYGDSSTDDYIVVQNINNVVEHPENYSNVQFMGEIIAYNAFTVSWQNDEFHAQYDKEDRGKIVIYLAGDISGSRIVRPLFQIEAPSTEHSAMTVDVSRVVGRIGGLTTLHIQFFSKDGSYGTSTQRARDLRVPANNAPVFAATVPATVEVVEAGGAQTPTSTELVTLAATDADPLDVVAYSIRNTLSSDDGRFFGVDSSTGVITLKAAKQLVTEAKQRYTLNVRADDSATPQLPSGSVQSSDRSIVIRATAPPVFDNAPDPFPVPEYLGDGGVAPVGYEIGAVTLTSGIANA
ncbi:MAG: cadherin domain-containing protein, partial [Betaproteobacteria bacterium]|nr:cadherin domain-containing protein [Betaproteobacteria bacterium]